MHSTITFALIGTYVTIATMANPLALSRVASPAPQIDADCLGPIVSVYAFIGKECNNNGTSSEDFSPFFYKTAFSTQPNGLTGSYQSECKRLNVPTSKALSIVYTSDGANTNNCYLNLFNDDDCNGKTIVNRGLDDDVSGCINEEVTRARVYCNQ